MPKVTKIRDVNRFMLMVMVIGLWVSGCTAATERLHPQFPVYRQAMGTMLVLVPDISIFEVMPDGGRIYQESSSHQAQRMAQQAIEEQLKDRRFLVQPVDADTVPEGEMTSIRSLFRSVNRAIQLHTIGPQVFPSKKAA